MSALSRRAGCDFARRGEPGGGKSRHMRVDRSANVRFGGTADTTMRGPKRTFRGFNLGGEPPPLGELRSQFLFDGFRYLRRHSSRTTELRLIAAGSFAHVFVPRAFVAVLGSLTCPPLVHTAADTLVIKGIACGSGRADSENRQKPV